MKLLFFVFIGLIAISCQEEGGSYVDKDSKDILYEGNWRLVDSEEPFDQFQTGLKFSKDGQVFNIDSQGQVVIPMKERLFSIKEDTLKFVDYRYEERFLQSRGTLVFTIEELTKDRMVLNVVYPEGPNHLVLENLN